MRAHISAVYRYLHSGRQAGWNRAGRWFFSEAQVRGLSKPYVNVVEHRARERAEQKAARDAETRRVLSVIRTGREPPLA